MHSLQQIYDSSNAVYHYHKMDYHSKEAGRHFFVHDSSSFPLSPQAQTSKSDELTAQTYSIYRTSLEPPVSVRISKLLCTCAVILF